MQQADHRRGCLDQLEFPGNGFESGLNPQQDVQSGSIKKCHLTQVQHDPDRRNGQPSDGLDQLPLKAEGRAPIDRAICPHQKYVGRQTLGLRIQAPVPADATRRYGHRTIRLWI